jgi:nitrite reductase/ring-hydroxylating ferredoxin subunit/DMSO/TMAO reductase YedYZ heme-binding membrane subunit
MSVQYVAVGWNRQKKIYDAVMLSAILLYLGIFVGFGAFYHPNATIETLLIRGLGTAALLMLHIILCIGPLCRLNSRFLPLLYNRRHLGVTMFFLAAGHGIFSLIQFHALGNVSPLVSLFASNTRFDSLPDFPFQMLGFLALLILFLMAATSHDFWLHNLSAPVWKRLHMLVYAAYGLLIAHVSLGALQSETSPVLVVLLGVGMAIVSALHIIAGKREVSRDAVEPTASEDDGFVEVCDVETIPEKRARVFSLGGERVAVFRYDGKVSALSNVCRHQNGPLGEGKVIDGCVTCPWHGYQYLPDSGQSPPPFTDKVPTYKTKIVGSKVFVHPCAQEPGRRLEPSRICGGVQEAVR